MPPATPSVPKFDDLMIPTLRALKALGGSASNDEVFDRVVADLAIPDSVRDLPRDEVGGNLLAYRLSWARTYLRRVGAIDRSDRGVWTLTDRGEGVTQDDVAAIKRSVRAAGFQKRKGNGAQEKAEPIVVLSEEEIEPEAVPVSWSEKLLAAVRAMKPDAFERLCQRILRESGFVKVDVTGRSGDGGIDGTGVLRVNLVSFKVAFQAKRYKGAVGSSVVRDFRGATVGRFDKGLIITTGTFTAEARREATRDGAPTIDLVDGETLCFLLKDLKLGTRVRLVEEVDVEAEFFASV